MPEEVVEEDDASEPVSKRLQVGDYAKVIEEGSHSAKVGDIVKIFVDDEDNQPFKCEDLQGNTLSYPWFREHELIHATEAEVKAETEPKEEPLKVGDYAKLISTNFNTNAELNEIVVINVEDKTVILYGIKNLKGEEIGWAPKDHLVKATGAEVLEAKQALLKVNDYARIISNEATTEACDPHEFEVGTVLKLHEFDSDDNTFETRYLNGDTPDAEWVHRKDLEPLTKEETEHIAREAEEEEKAKAEREEKEAQRLKWAAIGREVGELRKGDIVSYLRKDLLLGKVLSVNSNYSKPGDVRYYIDFGEEAHHVCTEKIDDLKLIATTESLFEQAPITEMAEKVE
ncbi:hypothetical protein ACQVV5_14655 [Bacillus pretiosus]